MARIFKTPFGAQGDTERVPEAPQGDGSVSLTQGFGYDYEREYEDPAAKDIRREVMNGLFHDITEAIGDIQLTGIAKWDADAAPYPAGAVVWHDSAAWMSTAGNNSSEPGVVADWLELTGGTYQSLTGGGALTGSKRYYITDSLTYTLPDTSGIASGASVVVTKEVGESPTVDTFGTEQIVTEAGSVASITLTASIESVFIWDGSNWNASAQQYSGQIGWGQSWQKFFGSRSPGVIYTNTTGRPISVAIRVTSLRSDDEAELEVDGVRASSTGVAGGGVSRSITLSALVPDGSEYIVTLLGGTSSIQDWAELR